MSNILTKKSLIYILIFVYTLFGQHAFIYAASEEADIIQQLAHVDNEDQLLQLLFQQNWSQKQIQDAFSTAIRKSYPRVVEKLIEHYKAQVKGANIQAVDDGSNTLLHNAAQKGHLNIVQFLVQEMNAPINLKNMEGQTPLYIAVLKGHFDVVQFLITAGAQIDAITNKGNSVLHIATQKGHLNIVKFLIASGARTDITNITGISLLHIAAKEGHLNILTFLIETGMPIDVKNPKGITPLDIAISRGHLAVAKFLISSEALKKSDPELVFMALSLAILYGRSKILRLIIKVGISSNFAYQGYSLLHLAATTDHCSIIDYLVENGADINAVTNAFESPLNIALKQETLEAASLLLMLGAHYTQADLHQMAEHKDFGNALWGLLNLIHRNRKKSGAAWQEIVQLKTKEHKADFPQWRKTSEGQACDVLYRLLSSYICDEPIPYLTELQTTLSQYVSQDLVKELFEFTGLPWRKVDKSPLYVPMDVTPDSSTSKGPSTWSYAGKRNRNESDQPTIRKRHKE